MDRVRCAAVRLRLHHLVLIATLSGLACGHDGVSPEKAIAGTYDLETVGGQPLPADAPFGWVVIAGAMTIREDGRFSTWVTHRDGLGIHGGPDDLSYGSWELRPNGAVVDFTYDAGGQMVADLHGDLLIVDLGLEGELAWRKVR